MAARAFVRPAAGAVAAQQRGAAHAIRSVAASASASSSPAAAAKAAAAAAAAPSVVAAVAVAAAAQCRAGLGTYYTRDHEWVRTDGEPAAGGEAVVGITDYAQEQLGDVVYVELPEEGTEMDAKDTLVSVESVKAASDVYAPVAGTVTAANETLSDAPETVNSGAETDGWMVKMTIADPSQFADLMDEAAYKDFLEE